MGEQPIHVAVVDDELEVHDLFRMKFRKDVKKGKMELVCFPGGKECLEFLKTGQVEIIILLSDINMPEMDGYSLLQIIKKDFPQIHVFMASAYGSSDYIEKAEKLGAEKYFTKPVDFNLLREEIYQFASQIQ